MKKIIVFLILFCFAGGAISYGYDITLKEQDKIITATNRIEDFINEKGDNYRQILVKKITEFKGKYEDERIQVLIGDLLKNIETSKNIDTQKKVLSELEKQGIPNLEYIYSTGSIEVMPFLLNKLLDEKEQEFSGLIDTAISDISFSLLEDYDQNDKLNYLVSLLNNYDEVNSNDQIRKVIEDFQPKMSEFQNEISFSEKLYKIYKKIQADTTLNTDQKRIIEQTLKRFELNGINLSEDKKQRLKEINAKLTNLSLEFGKNLLNSEKEFTYYIDKIDNIKDLPQDVLEATHEEAKNQGKDGYLFTINNVDYLIPYCNDEAVRKEIRQLYKILAADGKYDNRSTVLEMLKLREEMSEILGFKNYGEYSLSSKMATSPDFVINQEDEILIKAKSKIDREMTEIKEYFSLTGVNSWDLSYYSRILQEQKYQLDEEEVREYLEYENVKKGLFDIANKLYGLEFKEIDSQMYNEDVSTYEVYKDNNLLGYYILDPFYNPNKSSGAWAGILRQKNFLSNDRLPIVINILNISKGKENTLLTINEVRTIFHEFGHATHALASQSKYSELNGFNVERDFVELPSQLMENWANGEGLKTFAYHYKTGKIISDEMLEKIEKLKTFMKGIRVNTQIVYSRVDMLLHTQEVPDSVEELDKQVYDILEKISYFKNNEGNRFYANFSHIFNGGYAAGYYGYLRSEIIEADVFSVFKKNGIFNKSIAEQYYDKILLQGSRKPAIELFKDFMGRDIDLQGFYDKKGF